ncbi:helix-turn-helix domain-containing protein, partial [Streptococcus agalactiae]|uniref:helix-turn-helix domain-containing protein n=1 Tax=Streptococcus agalactiae TaxID=1311 RepID=UPI00374FE187
MFKYVPIFREFRLNRQFSLKQVASNELSVSQLSRFERGESDLSLTKFLGALEAIDLSISEFMDRVDFLRNKIWYNSSMNYEASKQLTDVRFKRLVGVQRTTFEEMLAVLKTAYQ